jgi:hypothetical protein
MGCQASPSALRFTLAPLPCVPQNRNRVNKGISKGGSYESNGVPDSLDGVGYVPLDSRLTGAKSWRAERVPC